MHSSIKVRIININETIADETFYSLMEKISSRTMERIGKFQYEKDKKRTLYGELLSRYMIMQLKQVANEEIEIAIEQMGKPYCKNYSNIHFNISHSGEWVVCVMCDSQVGVDIEQIKKVDWKIVERFFTEYEQKQLLLATHSRDELFYKLWTLKECYVKYIGKGLVIPFDSFEFDFITDKINLHHLLNNQLYFCSFKLFENYYLSICSEKYYGRHDFERITIKQLYEHI